METQPLAHQTSSVGDSRNHDNTVPPAQSGSQDSDETATNQTNDERARRDSFHGDSESTAGTSTAAASYTRVAGDEETAPRFEYPRQKTDMFTIAADCVSIALPLAMVLFVVALWRLEGTDVVATSEQAWDNGITVLATVFPILFASIVGRLVSEAARWALERGATVGLLEQLIGSRTVGSTVLTLIHFRLLSVMSLSLLIAWAMSPLGTQALLRMKSTRLEPRVEPTNVTYFDNSARNTVLDRLYVGGSGSYSNDAWWRGLAAMYTTLVSTPDTIKSDTMDLWGNVKIPFLGHAESDWKDIHRDAPDFEYSSLTGIPISNLKEGNTSFTTESSHLRLRCGEVTHMTNHPEYMLRNGSFVPLNGTTLSSITMEQFGGQRLFTLPNGTWHGYPIDRGSTSTRATAGTTWSLALDRFVDPLWMRMNNTVPPEELHLRDKYYSERNRPMLFRNETALEAGPTNLLLQAIYVYSMGLLSHGLVASCGITQEYVESRVNCSRGASAPKQTCQVVAQRRSQRKNAPVNISPLSFPRLFSVVSAKLPRTVGGLTNIGTEVSLYYLQDTSLSGMSATNDSERDMLSKITGDTLQIRLAQLINTYLTLGQLSHKIRGGRSDLVSETNETVRAETSELVIVYDISGAWAAACLASSIMLLAAGVLGVVFKHWARGPEILGYVSTVFRDSKHMDLPADASRQNGMDLSKGMKDSRIRYGVTKLTKDGEPVIGVGLQETTEGVSYSR
ncbi:hypothetical protein CSOJ01_15334 [Colletotrichum sojae]|uniref:Uncharacterized protein n=1 Tax=Colletotrichum sojae TaxID=2175907 RepID=A0A8H6MIV7_9PEZI|nr:hypothetical protein CSOJ01_15334 [Colletotrichum sojae]